MVDIKVKVVLGIFFLKISNGDMSFGKKALTWRFYAINKAFSTTKQVRIINKIDFAIAALDVGSKIFVLHVAIWEQEKILVHFER